MTDNPFTPQKTDKLKTKEAATTSSSKDTPAKPGPRIHAPRYHERGDKLDGSETVIPGGRARSRWLG